MKRMISIIIGCILILLCMGPGAMAENGTLRIPPDTKEIADQAFYGAKGFEKAVLPEGVTNIGASAFANSTLKEINLPESVRLIAESAFDGCGGMVAVVAKGSYAEQYCAERGIEYVYDGAAAADPKYEGTWYMLGEYYQGTIYEAPTDICLILNADGSAEFDGTAFSWSSDGGEAMLMMDGTGYPLIFIEDGILLLSMTEDNSAGIVLSRTQPGGSVTPEQTPAPEPGETVYTYDVLDDGTICLTGYEGTEAEVVVPETIDGYTISRILYDCFADSNSMTSIVLPEGVRNIDQEAFRGCINLVSVTLPDSVEEIDQYAFADCLSLTSINIPANLTECSGNPFSDCRSLTEFDISADHANFTVVDGVLYDKTDGIVVSCPMGLNKTSFTAPAGTKKIAGAAFRYVDTLTSVTLNEGLEEIAFYAFEDTSISEITLPASLAEMGNNPFEGCDHLIAINVAAGNEVYESVDGVLFDKVGKELIFYPTARTDSHYSIPEGTIRIGNDAFSNNEYLTMVTIPDSVQEIGGYAFYGCEKLQRIELPENLTMIGMYAFCYCPISGIVMPDSVIGDCYYAFSNCDQLEEVTLSKNLSEVASRMFYRCDALKEIVIPQGITAISDRAFAQSALTKITIPSSVTFIAEDAFDGCGEIAAIYEAGSYAEEYWNTYMK